MSAVVVVRNLQQNADVSGELVTQLSYSDLEQVQQEWNRVKNRATVEITAADESDDWNWPSKFYRRKGEHRFVGVRVEGRIEGLMQVSLNWIPERENGETKAAVLYVEHLETAPWNQGRYVGDGNRIYRQVGFQLIVAAGQLSERQGLNGRVGLHSLPASEGFYRGLRIGTRAVFDDWGLGFYEYPSLRYFKTVEG